MKLKLRLAAAAFLVCAALLVNAQQRPNFTGPVYPVTDGPMAAVVHLRFAAGTRTKWHSHDGGQIVLCESGVVRVQERGGPVIELHPGEVIYARPGVAHWHGSSPDQEGVQLDRKSTRLNSSHRL